ncbi:MAG TPA: hypothetical protein VKT73_15430 [Xanthobacteraceae bacterium]|nr:hypothetical protein [Xanthobacteraceae bacterium]
MVKKTEGFEESDQILAESITKISEGVTRLLNGGLKKRAIVVLLKDSTGVSMAQIEKVIAGLENLKQEFCQ